MKSVEGVGECWHRLALSTVNGMTEEDPTPDEWIKCRVVPMYFLRGMGDVRVCGNCK